MWQQWLEMASIGEEFKSTRNICLAGGELILEVHEIVIYVEKIGKEWFLMFMLGTPSEANRV